MIVLAFDYGLSHIGIAWGDTQTKLADPIETVKNTPEVFLQINKVVLQYQPQKLVVGVSEKSSKDKALEFARILKRKLSLPVVTVDETLSSFEAGQKIRHKPLIKRGEMRHSAAAAIILERWLEES